jgi:hypothetical protein
LPSTIPTTAGGTSTFFSSYGQSFNVGISAMPRSRIILGNVRSQGRRSISDGKVWARMSTPPSMATRAPALFDGWAMTNLPRACAAPTAAWTSSSGITTIELRVAHEPVKSFTPSAPASTTASTIDTVADALVSSGRRAGRM